MKTTAALLLATALACTAACDSSRPFEAHGFLYFGAGNYLGRFSLADGHSEPVRNLGDVTIRQVGPLREGRLLVTETREINQKTVSQLVSYDLDADKEATLRIANRGFYLHASDSLLYDSATELHRVRYGHGGEPEVSTVLEHAFAAAVSVVEVPSAGALIQVDSPAREIFLLADADDSLTPLAALARACDLDNAAWLPGRQALLCYTGRDAKGASVFDYVSLEGETSTAFSLQGKGRLTLLAHVEDQDLLVVDETYVPRFGSKARHAVWLYRADGREGYRIADDQTLGDFVAYRSH